MATPPRRGRGVECRWRSWDGTATHLRAFAKSRTYRVSTKADNSASKKVPRKVPVNYLTLANESAQGAHSLHCFPRQYCSIGYRLKKLVNG